MVSFELGASQHSSVLRDALRVHLQQIGAFVPGAAHNVVARDMLSVSAPAGSGSGF
jgi:hypothetical protein